MSTPFSLMSVIDNAPGSSALSGHVRVLAWSATEATDKAASETGVWLICMPGNSKTNQSRRKAYVEGPYREPLSRILKLFDEGAIYVLKLKPDFKLALSDTDRLDTCNTQKQRDQMKRSFVARDARYAAILPLLTDPDAGGVLPLSIVLNDSKLGARIAALAREMGCAQSTLYNWLHRYLAGGCQKNALLSNYDRCGNPGQPKPQRKKLGRSTRLFNSRLIDSRGYPLSDEDKEKLAHGYRLISHSTRPHDAYLVTCAVHWAVHHIDEGGVTRPTLHAKHLRPTFEQFKYWGRKLSKKSVSEMLAGPIKWSQQTESKGKSEQDSIVAIGQTSYFDGTSTDVYLVSVSSRLKVLPPMTRLVLKEGRSGLIYGIYCGWEAPSARTALAAIRHGAMPSKVEWAARYGVAIAENAIPGLLARRHLADNGELKGAQQSEAELQFGYGVDIAPAMSGQKKGSIETQHHSDHAHFDHRLSGSTRGKRRERGQDHASQNALLNHYEYTAELIRHIVWHNTEQEVPDLAPDDMLLADPPIKPTRVNIYHWLVERRMDVSIPVDYEAFCAFTLPEVNAVIRRNGVYLKEMILGRDQLLPRLRYTSPQLVTTGLLSQVKKTGSPIEVRLKMDRNDLSQAWLPTKAGLIRLTTSHRDQTILKKLTLDEWVHFLEDEVLRADLNRGKPEQLQADTVLRRMALENTATTQLKDEIKAKGRAPSKAERTRNLNKNRDCEIAFLREQEMSKTRADQTAAPAGPQIELSIQVPTAAEQVMDAFFEELHQS